MVQSAVEASTLCTTAILPKVGDNVFAASLTNTAINISYSKFCYY